MFVAPFLRETGRFVVDASPHVQGLFLLFVRCILVEKCLGVSGMVLQAYHSKGSTALAAFAQQFFH